jgi:nitroimidazol reductase NimA-like FMN-containing flavoprotein (pyridoxamine 5'-phosphate oxidase superfamily)
MFGELTYNEMEELIHAETVMRIGCHADGVTYIIPISYAYDGDYFYCRATEGKKLEMLRKNPDVCVQLDDTKNLSNWKSVICWGKFEELKENAEKARAIELLSTRVLPILTSETMHLAAEWPFTAESHDIAGVFFRIKIDKKTGRFEKAKAENFFAS